MDVIEKAVATKWCIGCGVCVAVCPRKRLKMCWNDRGEYNPVTVEGCSDCSVNCSLCVQVCPAHGETKNETEIGHQYYADLHGIQYKTETGYYLSSFVGYSNDHRSSGASGGVATWVLESLFKSDEVNSIVAVGPTKKPGKLFEFKILRNVEDIRNCSRSAYYPVESSHVIEHILKNEGRFAIIGLPCVCKAIRLAQDRVPKLRRRIKFVLGLTCGHLCSKFFAEYICALGKSNPEVLEEIIFRKKDYNQPASNFSIKFISGEGSNRKESQIQWRNGVSHAFTNGYFQLSGCFFCDDVFAECADAVFMDAWLPEYVNDPNGTSIFMIRHPDIKKIVTHGDLIIEVIDIDQVIKSQMSVVKQKRIKLTRQHAPVRRQKNKRRSMIDSIIVGQKYKLSQITGKCWNRNVDSLADSVKRIEDRIFVLSQLRRVIFGPSKIFNNISSWIHG